MPRCLTTSLLALLWVALLPSLAPAATYYVSPGGSGNACSQGQPCATINGGIPHLAPDDTLIVQPGTVTLRATNRPHAPSTRRRPQG